MNMVTPLSRLWLKSATLACCWLASVLSLHAQASGTGTIQGRVYNPAAKEYVRNAEVRLEGTTNVTYTENDGSFQFTGVPAGPASISVSFAGYTTVKESFTVTAGQTAMREINLTSTAAETKDGVIQLSAFTVASEREGNAKAIQAQRRDMNIITSVSSDIFGDVTDGNVGEFLKYLPGVDLDYVESEPRGPRLGGMEGQYVGVAFDGMRTASADANRGGGAASRATSFEGFSITAIDSIEINWTASPENDADTPAGNVNMRTKRAFDRRGRTIGYNFSANMNSSEFTLGKTKGPRDNDSRKVKPNFTLDYAESFFDRRFGVLLSVGRAHSFTEQHTGTDVGYNTTALPHDPRPLVARQLNYTDGPKTIFKDSVLLTADWKVSPRLVLSVNTVYSYYEGEFWNRSFTWVAANDNANVNTANGRSSVGGDAINTIIATRVASGSTPTSRDNTVAALNVGGGGSAKLVYTRQFAPRFEYKLDRWTIDGAFGISYSKNNYEAMERDFGGQTEAGGVASSWIATRPHARSWEWTIRQTSGNDWYDLRNFTSTNTRDGGTRISNRTELWITEKWTGMLNAKWIPPLSFLEKFRTSIKFGGKWDEESRDNNNQNDFAIWSYVGPGGNTVAYNPATETYAITSWGSWGNLGPDYTSRNDFEFGRTNALTVYNINGQQGMPPRASRMAPAALFKAHPEQFVNTATVENYYTAFIANKRDFVQTINAGYAQIDSRPLPKLQVRFGVRYEETRNELTEFDPLTAKQMLENSPYASQFTRNATTGIVTPSRATSVSGIFYQYTSNPRIKRLSNYHGFYPSIALKYNILPNLELQAGHNRSLSRPGIDSLTGLWVVDEVAQRVNTPNPELLPEKHKVYQSRLAYYFGGRSPGQLTLSVRQTQFENLILTQDLTPAEFGNEDPDFQNYTFRTSTNVTDKTRFRSMDFAYNQTLGFLPSEYLRGVSLGFNYSRTYWSFRRQNVAPHRISGRFGYNYRRFNGSLGLIWTDNKPEGSRNTNYGRYFGQLTKIDCTLNFRVNRFATLFVQGRNITNTLDLSYISPPGLEEGKGGVLRRMEEYGANWVFGVKGQF